MQKKLYFTKNIKMVVGPFMQGMLLMGVIYWYSKGMINMINEYYRSEFQKQLVETTPPSVADTQKPATISGTDEIELLLKQEQEQNDPDFEGTFSAYNDDVDHDERITKIIKTTEYCSFDSKTDDDDDDDECLNESQLKQFIKITLMVCFEGSKNSYTLGRVSNI